MKRKKKIVLKIHALFFLIQIYFNWRLINLQYCTGFAIHQHESATGVHVLAATNYGVTRTLLMLLWIHRLCLNAASELDSCTQNLARLVAEIVIKC